MIAIDLVNISNNSGTFTYLKIFVDQIIQTKFKKKILIYLCEDLYIYAKKKKIKKNIIFRVKPNYYSHFFLRFLWVQIFLLINLKVEKIKILYSAMNFCPILGKLFNVKIILGLHSNLPWTHLKLMPGNFLKKYLIKFFMELSIYCCDHLIVASNYAGKEIKKKLNLSNKRISTIYFNINKIFFKKKINKFIKDLDYNSNYLFSVMSCSRYHNIINILKAITNIKKKGIDINFYLVTKILDKEYYQEILHYIRENELQYHVKLFNNLDQDYLFNLYKYSNGYIFSSYSEVFGFTTLEAMCLKIPVATSNSSSLPEINGKGAIYFHPDKIRQIENCIKNLLFNKNLRKKLKLHCLENIKRFKKNDFLSYVY